MTRRYLPVNFKIIDQYQHKESTLMEKYTTSKHKISSFCGGNNTNFNLITCEDKIFIPLILQSYVLNRYHKYLLHKGIHITEAMICNVFYWPGIRKYTWKGS